MYTYNEDDYNFIEDEEFQEYLQSKLKGEFVPRYKFMTLLNKCKREYIYYLNNKHLYQNTHLY